MKTITIECGKGLQNILIDILEPIKLRKSEGTTNSRSTFEFIGTVDKPVQKIKNYGKGVYECLNIISVD